MNDSTNDPETRVLCDGELRVTVGGVGERIVLGVQDGVANRFWADISHVERVLHGEVVRLDALGGYCLLEPKGARVACGLFMEGFPPKACDFSIQALAEAIEVVRNLPSAE